MSMTSVPTSELNSSASSASRGPGVVPVVLAVLGLAASVAVIVISVQGLVAARPTNPADLRDNAALVALRAAETAELEQGRVIDPRNRTVAPPVTLAMELLANQPQDATAKAAPEPEVADALAQPFPPNQPFLAQQEAKGEPIPDKGLELIGQFVGETFGLSPREAVVPALENAPPDALTTLLANPNHRPVLQRGAKVYAQYCANCHGSAGAGNGPSAQAYVSVPRNFTIGVFNFVSTKERDKPLRDDLYLSIKYGFKNIYKNVSMPAFGDVLSPEDLNAVVDYTIYLSMRGETERKLLQLAAFPADEEAETLEDFLGADPRETVTQVLSEWNAAPSKVVPIPPRVPVTRESIERGRQLYAVAGCVGCHGVNGNGNGESFIDRAIFDRVYLQGETVDTAIRNTYADLVAQGRKPDLDLEAFVNAKTQLWNDSKTEWGDMVRPANLYLGYYKGGHADNLTAEDRERIAKGVYLRIAYGFNHGKMPAHYPGQLSTSDQVWDVVNFVLSLPYQPDLLANANADADASSPQARDEPISQAEAQATTTDTALLQEQETSRSALTMMLGLGVLLGLMWAIARDLSDGVRRTTENVLDELDGDPDTPLRS